METLARLEETGLSIWMRESGAAFFTSLTLHSLGMAFVVGINIAIGLILIGAIPNKALTNVSAAALSRFYPIQWYCAAVILFSGIALLLAYPAKALTNPVFYVKFAALVTALLISRYFQKTLSNGVSILEPNRHLKSLAYLSLVLWVVTITAGRFLAYTNSVLLASRFY